MPTTYRFEGTISRDFYFYIDAYTPEEALSRAKNGDYLWKDQGSGIEFVDIDLQSISNAVLEND